MEDTGQHKRQKMWIMRIAQLIHFYDTSYPPVKFTRCGSSWYPLQPDELHGIPNNLNNDVKLVLATIQKLESSYPEQSALFCSIKSLLSKPEECIVPVSVQLSPSNEPIIIGTGITNSANVQGSVDGTISNKNVVLSNEQDGNGESRNERGPIQQPTNTNCLKSYKVVLRTSEDLVQTALLEETTSSLGENEIAFDHKFSKLCKQILELEILLQQNFSKPGKVLGIARIYLSGLLQNQDIPANTTRAYLHNPAPLMVLNKLSQSFAILAKPLPDQRDDVLAPRLDRLHMSASVVKYNTSGEMMREPAPIVNLVNMRDDHHKEQQIQQIESVGNVTPGRARNDNSSPVSDQNLFGNGEQTKTLNSKPFVPENRITGSSFFNHTPSISPCLPQPNSHINNKSPIVDNPSLRSSSSQSQGLAHELKKSATMCPVQPESTPIETMANPHNRSQQREHVNSQTQSHPQIMKKSSPPISFSYLRDFINNEGRSAGSMQTQGLVPDKENNTMNSSKKSKPLVTEGSPNMDLPLRHHPYGNPLPNERNRLQQNSQQFVAQRISNGKSNMEGQQAAHMMGNRCPPKNMQNPGLIQNMGNITLNRLEPTTPMKVLLSKYGDHGQHQRLAEQDRNRSVIYPNQLRGSNLCINTNRNSAEVVMRAHSSHQNAKHRGMEVTQQQTRGDGMRKPPHVLQNNPKGIKQTSPRCSPYGNKLVAQHKDARRPPQMNPQHITQNQENPGIHNMQLQMRQNHAASSTADFPWNRPWNGTQYQSMSQMRPSLTPSVIESPNKPPLRTIEKRTKKIPVITLDDDDE